MRERENKRGVDRKGRRRGDGGKARGNRRRGKKSWVKRRAETRERTEK